jgi:putative intracellular protease/amidase
LGVLTFGVEQFSVLFVPGGWSARALRTVRAHSVLRVFAVFLRTFAFDPVLL